MSRHGFEEYNEAIHQNYDNYLIPPILSDRISNQSFQTTMPPRMRRRITSAKREEIEKQREEISQTIVRPFEVLSGLPVSFSAPPNGHYEDVLKHPLTIKDSGVLYRSLMKSRYNYVHICPMFKLYWIKQSSYAKKLAEQDKPLPKSSKDENLIDRSPVLGNDVNARDVMVKLCDASLTLGPHHFEIRLFIAKDERSDKQNKKKDNEQANAKSENEENIEKNEDKECSTPLENGSTKDIEKKTDDGLRKSSILTTGREKDQGINMENRQTTLQDEHQKQYNENENKQHKDEGKNVANEASNTNEERNERNKEEKNNEKESKESDNISNKTSSNATTTGNVNTSSEKLNPSENKEVNANPTDANTNSDDKNLASASKITNESSSAVSSSSQNVDSNDSNTSGTNITTPAPQPPVPSRSISGPSSQQQHTPTPGPSHQQNPPPPQPSNDPHNMQSIENTIMISNLNTIARTDQSLNVLMKIVASGNASPQEIVRFQGYIKRAREMGPQPHHAYLFAPQLPYQKVAPQVQKPKKLQKEKKPPKEKKLPKTKIKIPKEQKLTAFQEKYLTDATLLFEFVENANIRFMVPKYAICEILSPSNISTANNEEDNNDTKDILISYIWIYNQNEVDEYEKKLAEYEKLKKEREEEEEAAKKLKLKEEEALKMKKKEDIAKDESKATHDDEQRDDVENTGEALEDKSVVVSNQFKDENVPIENEDQPMEDAKEEVETVQHIPTKSTKRIPPSRKGRKKRRGPFTKKADTPKKLVLPVEPEIKYTAFSFTLHNIPSRYVPIITNSVKPLDEVQNHMSRILKNGTRLPNYYLWYQVDGKLDEALSEDLRIQLNQEEKKMPGIVSTSASSSNASAVSKKRKQKDKPAGKTKKVKTEPENEVSGDAISDSTAKNPKNYNTPNLGVNIPKDNCTSAKISDLNKKPEINNKQPSETSHLSVENQETTATSKSADSIQQNNMELDTSANK